MQYNHALVYAIHTKERHTMTSMYLAGLHPNSAVFGASTAKPKNLEQEVSAFLKDTRQFGQNLRHQAGVDFVAKIADCAGLNVKDIANFYRYGEIQTSPDNMGGYYHTFSPMLFYVGGGENSSEKSDFYEHILNEYPLLSAKLKTPAGRNELKELHVGSDERAKAFRAFVDCYNS